MSLPLSLNILTDLIIAILPVATIAKIHTTVWKKIGLIFLFGAIVFIIVANIIWVVMVLVVRCPKTPSSCASRWKSSISMGPMLTMRTV